MPVPNPNVPDHASLWKDLDHQGMAKSCAGRLTALIASNFKDILLIVRSYYDAIAKGDHLAAAQARVDFNNILDKAGIPQNTRNSISQAVFGGDLSINW